MLRKRTLTQRLSLARWLALVGILGAILLGFFSYQNLQNRVDALARIAVPGHITVEVPEPTGLTIYYEDPTARGGFIVQASGSNTLAFPPVALAVNGPSGESVATVPYEGDLRFNHDGRVVTALATIDAPTAGTYTIAVSGNVPAGPLVSVGDVVDLGLIVEAASAIALFVGSLLVLLTAVAVAAIKRRTTAPIAIQG